MFRVHHYHHYPGLEVHQENGRKLELILKKLEKIMTAIEDLRAAQEELSTEVTRIAGEIDQLLAVIGNPGTPDADVVAATERVRGFTAALRAAADKSDAAVPG